MKNISSPSVSSASETHQSSTERPKHGVSLRVEALQKAVVALGLWVTGVTVENFIAASDGDTHRVSYAGGRYQLPISNPMEVAQDDAVDVTKQL